MVPTVAREERGGGERELPEEVRLNLFGMPHSEGSMRWLLVLEMK
jgi:hypothetical protein